MALERELSSAVPGEVRFDAGSRGLYAHDASNYRQVPIGVVIPRDAEDVLATLRICRAHTSATTCASKACCSRARLR